MELREATEADVSALHALYGHLGDSAIASPERLAEILTSMRRYPDYHVYLALDEGEVVGTFALLIAEAPGARGRPIGVVEDVVVEERRRGRGIGRAMMEFARQRCRSAGCYKMMLSSNLNREQAHAFYESLGFEKHGCSFVIEP